jgi:hypothetical protein
VRRLLLGIGVCLCALRCGGDSPGLDAVMPNQGPTDAETDVVISGHALSPLVREDVGCDGRAETRIEFGAQLRTSPAPTALLRVAWQSSGDVHATVPAGIAPGQYDLDVAMPSGKVVTLPQAFRVVAPGDGGIDDGGDGSIDGGLCENIFANQQMFTGTGLTPVMAQNTIDGINGTVGSVNGAYANVNANWVFTFGNALPPGAVTAARIRVGIFASGYVDDHVQLDVSRDGGNNWVTLKNYGPGVAFPTVPGSIEGPFDIPGQNQAPAAGQLKVRLLGAGRANGIDTFTVTIDGVELDLCR